MRLSYAAFAATAVLAACNQASAQSTTDVLQRLEALENSNADLKKENAALRDRVRRIESAKPIAYATTTTPSSTTGSSRTAPGYAGAPPVYKSAPMAVPPPWTWTGFYIGGHGGYAWGQATGRDVHIDEKGGFGGVQMGLNYQFWDHWVLGLEQDASLADLTGNFPVGGGKGNGSGNQPVSGGQTQGTGTFKVDALGTFRARAGYSLGPVLLYETAGVAWADAHPTIVITSTPSEVLHDRRSMTGLAAGGGIEVAAVPNLTLKAEYLYLDFPDKNFFAGTDQAGAADLHVHTVRAGMNWLFH